VGNPVGLQVEGNHPQGKPGRGNQDDLPGVVLRSQFAADVPKESSAFSGRPQSAAIGWIDDHQSLPGGYPRGYHIEKILSIDLNRFGKPLGIDTLPQERACLGVPVRGKNRGRAGREDALFRLFFQKGPSAGPERGPLRERKRPMPARRNVPGHHGCFQSEGARAAHGIDHRFAAIVSGHPERGRGNGLPDGGNARMRLDAPLVQVIAA
jgi:hypothetical protein